MPRRRGTSIGQALALLPGPGAYLVAASDEDTPIPYPIPFGGALRERSALLWRSWLAAASRPRLRHRARRLMRRARPKLVLLAVVLSLLVPPHLTLPFARRALQKVRCAAQEVLRAPCR